MLKREHFLGWPLRRICCVAFWLWLLGSLFSIAAADYQAAWEVRIGSEADKYGGGCISGNLFSVSL